MSSGKLTLNGHDITKASIRQRSKDGMSHIPEDRHKHGLILDYTLEQNMVLQRYWQPEFQKHGIIRFDKVREYSDRLIEQYDVRSGQGSITIARSMSGGNTSAREIDKRPGAADCGSADPWSGRRRDRVYPQADRRRARRRQRASCSFPSSWMRS